MDLEKWKSQIVRGTLEYSVLLMLKNQTRYGYEIVRELSNYPMLSSSESTIYPLLRRLQKEKVLDSMWKDSLEGLPPRKYYVLTEVGEAYLSAQTVEWEQLLAAMSDLRGDLSNGWKD